MPKVKTRYPFKTMTVGGKPFEVTITEAQQLRNAASHFVKDSEPDWKFKIVNTGAAISCFRVK